jgi:hypothetical protein
MYPPKLAEGTVPGTVVTIPNAIPFIPSAADAFTEIDVLDSLDAYTALKGLRGEPDKVCVLCPNTQYELLEVVVRPDVRFDHQHVTFVQTDVDGQTVLSQTELWVEGTHQIVFGRVKILAVPGLAADPIIVLDDISMPIPLEEKDRKVAVGPKFVNGLLCEAGVEGYIFLQHLCEDLKMASEMLATP